MLIHIGNAWSKLVTCTDEELAFVQNFLSYRISGFKGKVKRQSLLQANTFPAGLSRRLIKVAREAELNVEVLQRSQSVEILPGYSVAGTNWSPREHQKVAIDAIRDKRRGLIQHSTGCLAGDTIIECNRAGWSFKIRIDELAKRLHGERIGRGGGPKWDLSTPTLARYRDQSGHIRLGRVSDAYSSGVKLTYTVTTECGKVIRATADHRFLTSEGWRPLSQVGAGSFVWVAAGAPQKSDHKSTKKNYHVTPGLKNHPYACRRNVKGGHSVRTRLSRVVSIVENTEEPTYDISMEDEPHNFVASGFVVHNSGKGDLIGVLAALIQGRILIIATSKKLQEDLVSRCRKFGVIAGQLGSGHNDTRKRVVVVNDDSLKKLTKQDLLSFQAIMADECFPKGTLVSGRPIEDLRVGEFVESFCEVTKQIVWRPITRKFVSKPSKMVRVHLSNGQIIACTAGHPFYTKHGWIEAASLCRGSVLLSTNETRDKSQLPAMRGLQRASATNRQAEDHDNWPGSQSVLLRRPQAANPERNQNSSRPQARITDSFDALGTHEGQEPHARSRSESQNVGNSQTDRPQAEVPGREWSRADRAAAATRQSAWLANGDSDQDPQKTRERLSNVLQGRHRGRSQYDCHRSGWGVSPESQRPSEGRQKNRTIVELGVDRVEVLEPGSDGTFGGVCPDGNVYNVEVEGTHTYTVDGVIVHNCHGVASKTLQTTIMKCLNAEIRLGFSATALDRADKKGLFVIGALGETIHRYTPQQAAADGVIAKARLYMPAYQHRYLQDTEAYVDWEKLAIATNATRNLMVLRLVHETKAPRILFVRTKIHQQILVELLGESCGFVNDETPKDQADATVKRLRSGQIGTLVSTPIYRQGVDIPEIKTVINAAGGKATIDVIQKVGRGSRILQPDGSKKESFEVYDIKDEGCGCLGELHKSCEWLHKHSTERRKAYEKFGYNVETSRG